MHRGDGRVEEWVNKVQVVVVVLVGHPGQRYIRTWRLKRFHAFLI